MPRRPRQPVEVPIIDEINHLHLKIDYLIQHLDAMQLPYKDVVGFDYDKDPMYDEQLVYDMCSEELVYEGVLIYDEELEYNDEPDVVDYDGFRIFDEDVDFFEEHPLVFMDSFNESKHNDYIGPPIFDKAPLEGIGFLIFEEVPSGYFSNNFLVTHTTHVFIELVEKKTAQMFITMGANWFVLGFMFLRLYFILGQ